jgi:hypothetical protein
MSIEVEAGYYRQAHENALRLAALLKDPLVRMAVEGAGIRLSGGDGKPIVYQPLPEGAGRA